MPNTDVTISGLAHGSRWRSIAGVEVSFDNGATWHRATGQSNWSFNWHTGIAGAAPF